MMAGLQKRAFLKTLEGLEQGRLTLVTSDGPQRFGDLGSDLSAVIEVRHPRFYNSVLFGGEDGAAESYLNGDWTTPDLVSVIRLAVRNLQYLGSSNPLLTFLSRGINRLRHLRNNNTVAGSRRNIHAHYDLSNDFFRLFLDRRMVYSAGFYESSRTSLEEAQVEKIDRLCRKLQLRPGDRLLEIGTGWGALALHATQRYGCQVTTTTISREQHDYAAQLFAQSGERITLLQEDYRKLSGQFDKIVSVEMFEAVGFDHYDEFFGACDRLLAPDGLIAMQAITMNEHRFAEYRRSSDFIQKYIFPGAELASLRGVLDSLLRSTKLGLFHLEDLGLHYAVTLAEWRRRFHQAEAAVRALGFDDRFLRLWDYYLAYCEGAFRERYISDVQLVLSKNGNPQVLFGEPWADAPAEPVEARKAVTV